MCLKAAWNCFHPPFAPIDFSTRKIAASIDTDKVTSTGIAIIVPKAIGTLDLASALDTPHCTRPQSWGPPYHEPAFLTLDGLGHRWKPNELTELFASLFASLFAPFSVLALEPRARQRTSVASTAQVLVSTVALEKDQSQPSIKNLNPAITCRTPDRPIRYFAPRIAGPEGGDLEGFAPRFVSDRLSSASSRLCTGARSQTVRVFGHAPVSVLVRDGLLLNGSTLS